MIKIGEGELFNIPIIFYRGYDNTIDFENSESVHICFINDKEIIDKTLPKFDHVGCLLVSEWDSNEVLVSQFTQIASQNFENLESLLFSLRNIY